MSITLPPFPAGVAATDRMREYATAYARAAIEDDRARRVPMTDAQMSGLTQYWRKGIAAQMQSLIRAVEAHHGIGAKP